MTTPTTAKSEAATETNDDGATATANPAVTPAVILFGTDEGGKPHASTFTHAEVELAERAAGLMGLRVLHITTDEHRAVAVQLPAGRIFAQSGRGFVPFVKKALYERLLALAGPGEAPPSPIQVIASSPPSSDAPTPASDPARPAGWDTVKVGSLVLASTGPQEGWFESIVVYTKADSLFELRWRDWPEEAHFVRHRDALALLSPLGPEA
ncbi:hypothetical protein [Methylobacterium sp. E-045]|uniref:hypothetical protein n=1 Tax=Methylobacterium sp. E-045 TaxID=2836575 RepID=UPI001FBB037A|nr:hypothetical protein [Methylobacterium sp. E-045]MCJ2131191.1 hypothetical protein [Methylobacterium sp. E-045]